jgi:hypothetical protein
MHRKGLSALGLGVLLTVLAACADGTPLPRLSSMGIDAPPGEDSGEPFLSVVRDTVHLSWLERSGPGRRELRVATFTGEGWRPPIVIEASDRFFVNWADLPSVTSGPDGSLWAHWLERGADGGYGVRVSSSGDGGASWSEPWTPHDDRSATEHGFVATVPMAGGLAVVWLDGRAFAAGRADRAETALYHRVMGADGPAGPEAPIDPRVCDCCQTDAATTSTGPVLVYRDRGPEEIRDIAVTRWIDGAWTEPRPVHADGWETGACPVNGPAVDARGTRVAVAWFTAADGVPRVKTAFSRDAGETFGEPIVVDDGDPSGRVDLVLLDDGAALVSWLERTGGELAEVRVRYVAPNGRTSASSSVSASSTERASGFPRMARASGDRVVVAWTDVGGPLPRVRVATVNVSASGSGW